MIEPTPGRVVWYRARESEVGEAGLTPDGNKPLAAHLAFVHSPTVVNLMIIDAKGRTHGRESVQLIQDGEVPEGACTWMPFQKGQAAKADESAPKIAALEEQVAVLTKGLAAAAAKADQLEEIGTRITALAEGAVKARAAADQPRDELAAKPQD